MFEVYVARDAADAECVRELLEREGIGAIVQGAEVHGLFPHPGFLPKVCVLDEANVARASEIVDGFRAELEEDVEP